jgi:hypothetical protein
MVDYSLNERIFTRLKPFKTTPKIPEQLSRMVLGKKREPSVVGDGDPRNHLSICTMDTNRYCTGICEVLTKDQWKKYK